MAMEALLDGVRRIVHKWVNTTQRIQSDVNVGDTYVCIKDTTRFSPGDPVMLYRSDTQVYETGLYVDRTEDNGIVHLVTAVQNNWTVADGTVLVKTINEQFVQAIHIGGPEVLGPKFPQITVNGINRSSEWFTLESTKERYEIEIGVYVQASTHEQGYRFLMQMTDEIQKGLKNNLQPLVSDYDIISLTRDVNIHDTTIYVNDVDPLQDYRRIIVEDDYVSHENWVISLYDQVVNPSGDDDYPIRVKDPMHFDFDKDTTSVIVPKRFIYNSWPHNIQYGTIHTGELLKASKISWFAEEEEMQFTRRDELKLK